MASLRKILYPFGVLYGSVTAIRNLLFDKGILGSQQFDVPVIAIGNLSVGGTGKTPMVEYLIRLLSDQHRVAVLSRGYGRKTRGFILASDNDSAATIGDEPFQYHTKFQNVAVAVDADRRNGIGMLLKRKPAPDVILLDDAFQHRRVRAGMYILLTAYDDLYTSDLMLPAGNLREWRSGAARADMIVVTKCPNDLSAAEQEKIRLRLRPTGSQQLFFTSVSYDSEVISDGKRIDAELMKKTPKVLVTGIAKPKPFLEYLRQAGDAVLEFSDHHDFSDGDIRRILQQAGDKPVVTTEKDYVRLKEKISGERLFYLPIKTSFLAGGANFDKSILDFAGKH